ncbi:MAG: GlcG/HbpS family heme-binding protein [Bosea sp. (in: a-proteobacteria)]|uniref:GlcG/HbpS family heme-binding protein n=1 Tax=unclassified Bosea (in: a-proteobacteria) TaxID=2653178 RepID=UPI0009655E2A|nr:MULTISPECIES: heme-binding protein [unclassified Bosea (in: a-proteobacteria)]MBN9456241.1 heme-binding protein [Bosea sp. (in: a-proteobacteria)]OJV05733.1 MAG: GlcG protein [Bosea sp. 67-29]
MLTLVQAQTILSAALAHATTNGFKPLAIAIIDARGAQKAFAAQDGTSLKRGEIALGKAHGVVALGLGSRALHKMAQERPYFIEAATHAVGGLLVPVPGGVLIRSAEGDLLGAIGISGDTSDNDEAAATAGIAAAGLHAETGA